MVRVAISLPNQSKLSIQSKPLAFIYHINSKGVIDPCNLQSTKNKNQLKYYSYINYTFAYLIFLYQHEFFY